MLPSRPEAVAAGLMIPDRLVVTGGARLAGSVSVPGAKNAVLPMMAACLLTEETCRIRNVPLIEDVEIMAALLRRLGATVEFDRAERRLTITAADIRSVRPDPELVHEMRASFLVTGALLARFGQVECVHPGGCEIGIRPVNVDMNGFRAMGAEILVMDGAYVARAPKLQGSRIYLDYPSHTGTENLLMAACLAEGYTTIVHASREPEVLHLIRFLRSMGAEIRGEGTSVVEVKGRSNLWGASYRTMPDRLVAGTFAIAAAITGGEVELREVWPEHLEPIIYKLRDIGVEMDETNRSVVVHARNKLRATEVQSMPYPGFPTDKQAEMAALLTQAEGESVVVERVFEDRFRYAEGLRRMGADIDIGGARAVIRGPSRLRGIEVSSGNDLRSGAAMVVAGLAAEGETTILDARYVHRGYESLADDLIGLGASIRAEKFVAPRVQL